MEKGHLRIKTAMDISDTMARIKQLENQIIKLKAKLQAAKEHPDWYSKEEISAMQVELDNSIAKVNELRETMDFSKGTKGLLKFGLALFAISGSISVLKKASQSYLSQNENTAKKLQSMGIAIQTIWDVIGEAIGPIIEKIADGVLKLIGYLNEFLKVFGIDIVAKANAKALEKQAKAQQNLNKQNKQAYDFDVIRTQKDSATNMNGSLSKYGGIDLSGVQLNENIVKKLQDLAYWLKENWHWIKEVGKILGVVFGVAAINKILKRIGKLLGSATLGTGLLGLANVLSALAIAYEIVLIIKGVSEIVKGIQEVKEAYDSLTKSVENATQKDKKNADAIWKAYEAGEIGKEGLKNYKKVLDKTTESVLDQVSSLEKNKSSSILMKGANEEITKSQQAFVDELSNTTDEYKKLYEAGAITDEEYNDFIKTLQNAIPEFEKNGLNVDNLKTKYENLTGQKYYVKVYAKLTDNVSEKIKQLVQEGVNVVLSSGNGGKNAYGSGSGGGGFRGMALGGIVTQPTRALIGEAGYPEAVMPMTPDYLSTLAGLIAQYGGNSGNGTVNVYLDGRLIERQISNRQNQRNFVMNR